MILLLQPTQPLRQPKHLQAAIALLRETQADSVVGVVELPRTHHPHWQGTVIGGQLVTWDRQAWSTVPSGRQALRPTYIRDGTVYAFWRRTVTEHGSIYGEDVRPLIIPHEETCALDTMADWAEAERRLRERVPAYDHDDAEADG